MPGKHRPVSDRNPAATRPARFWISPGDTSSSAARVRYGQPPKRAAKIDASVTDEARLQLHRWVQLSFISLGRREGLAGVVCLDRHGGGTNLATLSGYNLVPNHRS